jgi:hypothetical protein
MAGLQLYRQTTIGDCLDEALDEMVTAGKLPGELATKMMAEVCVAPRQQLTFAPPAAASAACLACAECCSQFDVAMLKALETRVTTRTTFKGHLDSYRFCDQVPACMAWLPCAMGPASTLQ